MIFGIGIDLCDAGRLEKSLAKQSFLDHVFAPSEQALLASLGEKRRAETAAANFAAKEAFSLPIRKLLRRREIYISISPPIPVGLMRASYTLSTRGRGQCIFPMRWSRSGSFRKKFLSAKCGWLTAYGSL